MNTTQQILILTLVVAWIFLLLQTAFRIQPENRKLVWCFSLFFSLSFIFVVIAVNNLEARLECQKTLKEIRNEF